MADEQPTQRTSHWENVYRSRNATDLSWFQAHPEASLELLLSGGITPASVIDVGGGESTLVDHLLAAGVGHVTLLDLSGEALQRTCARLGHDPRVRAAVADITTWTPQRRFAAWHDRATLHFLTDSTDVQAYAHAAAAAVEPGGRAVIGTFGEDGPDSCSGLPVKRYTADGLVAVLGDDFALERTRNEIHLTPSGQPQHFVWVAMTRHSRGLKD